MLSYVLFGLRLLPLLLSIDAQGLVHVPSQEHGTSARSCVARELPPGIAPDVLFASVPAWDPPPDTNADALGMAPSTEAVAGKEKSSLNFTRKGKSLVKKKNAEKNGGKIICENCKAETVPGEKHVKGKTPPSNEAQVDHVIPKARGGKGDPSNGQVLCRDCNIEKSDKLQ
jgi:hypothetical protein